MSPFLLILICLTLIAYVSSFSTFEKRDFIFKNGRCEIKNPCPKDLIGCTQFNSSSVVCSKPVAPGRKK